MVNKIHKVKKKSHSCLFGTKYWCRKMRDFIKEDGRRWRQGIKGIKIGVNKKDEII